MFDCPFQVGIKLRSMLSSHADGSVPLEDDFPDGFSIYLLQGNTVGQFDDLNQLMASVDLFKSCFERGDLR